jgi:hypothetical protein
MLPLSCFSESAFNSEASLLRLVGAFDGSGKFYINKFDDILLNVEIIITVVPL